MISIVPKITDVNSLKTVSTLLTLPMLCVAYFLQSGAQIGWDGNTWFNIPVDLPSSIQVHRLLLIFFLKSVWISFLGMFAYGALGAIHIYVKQPILPMLAVVMLAFGILGIFARDAFPLLNLIGPFWFYASIVWALFLNSMTAQMDESAKSLQESGRS
jgi:hypothetical protein